MSCHGAWPQDDVSRALETDSLRVELAVDAAGIGDFDWDLVTGG